MLEKLLDEPQYTRNLDKENLTIRNQKVSNFNFLRRHQTILFSTVKNSSACIYSIAPATVHRAIVLQSPYLN